MPANIEVKAHVLNRDALIEPAQQLAGAEGIDIEQDDTFFRCAAGRLKLRTFSAEHGQLIFYQRPDAAGPSASFYTATVTTDPDGLRQALTLAYGTAGRVRKHRVLVVAGRTRIHLDRVEGLGDFVELEVAIDDPADARAAATETEEIMSALGIEPAQLVPTAYVDLINVAR